MKSKWFVLGALALLTISGIIWSCRKEETPLNSDNGLMLKSISKDDCGSCVGIWEDSNATYTLQTNEDGTKYLKFDVYNDFDTVNFRLYGSESLDGKSYNVTIDGVRFPPLNDNGKGNPQISITGDEATWTVIKEDWQACTELIINSLDVNGANENNFGAATNTLPDTFYMQELCTNTTLEADLENPVCVGSDVILKAKVSASEDVTAGTLMILDENNQEVASATIDSDTDSVTYTYTPEAAGSAGFHAEYTGSGGFADSNSGDLDVVAEDCSDGCTESFSYDKSYNADSTEVTVTFQYTPDVDLTDAKLVFTFAQGVTVDGDLAAWEPVGVNKQETMDMAACGIDGEPYEWSVVLSARCNGVGQSFTNGWTDFTVNGISKKLDLENIKVKCTTESPD